MSLQKVLSDLAIFVVLAGVTVLVGLCSIFEDEVIKKPLSNEDKDSSSKCSKTLSTNQDESLKSESIDSSSPKKSTSSEITIFRPSKYWQSELKPRMHQDNLDC